MRKTVFVNIWPVLQFWTKKVVYTKSKFSPGFSPFQTCWEKWSFWVFLSFFLRVTFLIKNRIFLWISPKMFQNNRKAWFSCLWHIFSWKTVFVNICPVILLWTKRVVYNRSKFSSEFAPFLTCQEKHTF